MYEPKSAEDANIPRNQEEARKESPVGFRGNVALLTP